jgi:DNA-directed RNA polymerase
LTYGVNPQGSDLQKALLHFAEGKKLDTPEAIRWFHIQGANKFGFDKATLDDRVAWVKTHQQMILAIGSDPVNCNLWHDADSPLQFLAWCLEYCEWHIDPRDFESRIPVSMDGSCNGLQNFSAMLRDEVGGKATNLTNNKVMEDIYKRVADAAMIRLAELPKDEAGIVDRWMAHGINRSVVKRAVMTTPYGVTKRSAIRYVIDDYMRKGSAPMFSSAEHYSAASLLMNAVWPAIGDVVVKSREAMVWLSSCAKVIASAHGDEMEGVISWCTPSGFLSTQSYYELQEYRIRTRIHGTTLIKIVAEKDSIDGKRHSNGLAPNFVHSMDASHLHLTAAKAADSGIDALAMIHDDYGTHAADAERLYRIIRSEFVRMYENHDPLEEFHKAYPCCSIPPSKGTLDIREVLDSQYFFS